MIKTIIFSKDRPLQLHACLESLFHYSDLSLENTYIIYNDKEESYNQIRNNFIYLNWINDEDHFDQVLRNLVDSFSSSDHVLLVCDDAVFVRHFEFVPILQQLQDESVLSFSLRLGNSIHSKPKRILEDGCYRWKWPGIHWHWGYPFDVSSCIFKQPVVKFIIDHTHGLKNPNSLEAAGDLYCKMHMGVKYPWMCHFDSDPICVFADVNRVQDVAPNPFHGGPEENAKVLAEKYRNNYRLNWKKFADASDPDVYVGTKYWELIKK